MKKPSALKLARVTRGMTQTELAAKIGRHQTSICEFERGCRVPTFKGAKKISRILEVPLTELFPELLDDDDRSPPAKGAKTKEVSIQNQKGFRHGPL